MDLSFQKIPRNYQEMLDNIYDRALQKLYKSEIDFKYLSLKNNDQIGDENHNSLKLFLTNFLKKYHFITYKFSNISNIMENLTANHNQASNSIDIIFCVENSCIIIEQIDKKIICEIINDVNKTDEISMINVSTNINILPNNAEEMQVKEEISAFCFYDNFSNEIKQNLFVKNTINPIAGFLIRRYFYPTNYFSNPSFFNFNNQTNLEEKNTKISIDGFLFSESMSDYDDFQLEIKTNKKNQTNQTTEFKKSDFILLRTIVAKETASIYLVIHIETLYVFCMKELNLVEERFREHEIEFCEKYSHRCMTHFYGFIKEENIIKGFIYEFMSNGSLLSYIKNKQSNDIFQKTTIIRLFQCLDYLFQNSLIHRDIKPGNILIDHDFIPFISDFETVRNVNQEGDNSTNEKMTNDIGSCPYMSPEQNSDRK